MASGQILRGAGGCPLHGNDGTLLYATPISAAISITISWADGDDLDICAFFSHRHDARVGYSYAAAIADAGDGFTASWGGDNTSGGPETVNLAYSGAYGIAGRRFEIHCNWYNTGSGHSGGDATITATDASGATFTYTTSPAHSTHKAASPSSPGAAIVFNRDGTISGIVAA